MAYSFEPLYRRLPNSHSPQSPEHIHLQGQAFETAYACCSEQTGYAEGIECRKIQKCVNGGYSYIACGTDCRGSVDVHGLKLIT